MLFNCRARIRRHIEHLVELEAEHRLVVFVWSGMLCPDVSVSVFGHFICGLSVLFYADVRSVELAATRGEGQ